MIPVDDSSLINYDVENKQDEDYRITIYKELEYIRKNINKIKKNAETIYRQKKGNYDINYLNSTLGFQMLENKLKEYVELTNRSS